MSDLFTFIEKSPTAYHATRSAEALLKEQHFEELHEKADFKLKARGRYYLKRDSGALIAFILPQREIKGTRVMLSHTDSPTFRLKPEGEFQQENMILWGLEVYGGPIYASWLNRDLGIAGRIFVEQGGEIREELVHIEDSPVMITQMPIHLDRTVNTEGLKLSPQEHLNVLATLTQEKPYKGSYLESLLKKKVSFKKLIQHELYLCPLEAPRFLGDQKDLFSAPRIDNLLSVSASLEAFLKVSMTTFEETMPMIYLANHEEIGSKTYSGADSSFFINILKRIFFSQKGDFEGLQKCLAHSFALSLDGAHALDPKSPEKFEPRHTPLLGEGLAIKVDTGAAYAYSVPLLATIRQIAEKHKIKIQNYVKRGDQRQGSTVGPMFVEKTSIPAVDLGCAQLSMHSIREVASLRDYIELVKLINWLYQI